MAADVACCGTQFSLFVLVIIGLVCFAGLMAGLTLGLMSLGLVDLEVLIKSGRPKDRLYAGTSLSHTSSSFLSFPLFVFFLWVSFRGQNEETFMKVGEKKTMNFYINPTTQLAPDLINLYLPFRASEFLRIKRGYLWRF